jgi:Asp-tRNA(Asn)/Glu-tRNA(Gln) amidotransferase A subunit family amidase
MPGGELGGLPVSLSLIGPAGSELALIDLGATIA